MKLHRTGPFLHAYRLLPHRLLNRAAARLTAFRHPRFLVDAAVRSWIRRGRIDMAEFEDRRFDSIDDFFLRRVRDGARPIGEGFVSPVDGIVVASGEISPNRVLSIKGRPLSVDRMVNGGRHSLSLDDYEGGKAVTIFLTPDGYHRIHMPAAGTIRSSQFIPGRFHPQNEDALLSLPRVYEKNERLILRCRLPERSTAGMEFILVLVGASLIGGIELKALPRSQWAKADGPRPLDLQCNKGDEIAHFRFGSTVVVLLPRTADIAEMPVEGTRVRMGETLLQLSGADAQ